MGRGAVGIEVIRRGEASARPPLVLVHGAWHGAWCWDRGFMDALADRGHEVLALSLRGHGNSRGGGRLAVSRHGVAGFVEDVATVVAGLGRPPVLVGHSLGGFVVQRYLCERRPAHGAVLLASVPPTGVLPLFLRLLRSDTMATTVASLTLNLGHLLAASERASRLLFSALLDEGTLEAIRPHLGGESYRAFLEMLAPRLRVWDAVAPVAVLAAGADALITPAEAWATARAWGAEPVTFDDMGHDMMLAPGWQAVAAAVSRHAGALAPGVVSRPPKFDLVAAGIPEPVASR